MVGASLGYVSATSGYKETEPAAVTSGRSCSGTIHAFADSTNLFECSKSTIEWAVVVWRHNVISNCPEDGVVARVLSVELGTVHTTPILGSMGEFKGA